MSTNFVNKIVSPWSTETLGEAILNLSGQTDLPITLDILLIIAISSIATITVCVVIFDLQFLPGGAF